LTGIYHHLQLESTAVYIEAISGDTTESFRAYIEMRRGTKARKGRKGSRGGGRGKGKELPARVVKDILNVDTQRIRSGVNLRWKKPGRLTRPFPGAMYTVRQMPSTFGQEVGLTAVGGNTAGVISQSSSSTDPKFAIAFQLNDLAQASSFAAVFDQYRIDHVSLYFKSCNNAIGLAGASAANQVDPTMLLVVDRDDNNAPSSYASLTQYDNVIEVEGQDSAQIDLVPSITSELYAGGAFSGYQTKRSDGVWVDVANLSVPVYGVKGSIGLLAGSVTYDWTWLISAVYTISFRNTR